jgi:hypothetical protein
MPDEARQPPDFARGPPINLDQRYGCRTSKSPLE